jgi:hypothetical protein
MKSNLCRAGRAAKVIIPIVSLLLLISSETRSQQIPNETPDLKSAWGMDILISDSGLGLGGFYRRQISPDWSGFISLAISESKDSREIELITWWGEKFVPGKVNRFLMAPLHVGVERRLFRTQIMDNFRPFISAAIGPTIIYTTPYEREFFNALGHGKAYYTAGGYVGFGAHFGSDGANLVGINFRYYYIPYFGGINSLIDTQSTVGNIKYLQKKQFGGFFITLTFGMAG